MLALRVLAAGSATAVLALVAGCSGSSQVASSGSASASPSGSSSGAPSPAPASSTTTSTTTTAAPTCGERLAADLTPAQRAGQLLMVGLEPTGSSRALAAQVKAQDLGGVIYLGGWFGGRGSVATVSARLQAAAGGSLLVAADQEGGQVQQLRGPGFTRMPSARAQAANGATAEEATVEQWSRELAKAGVNINLAPVADTVPTSLGAANQPIGRFRRDFAPGDARVNAIFTTAFVKGTLAAGIAPTVKHFPGLGRITGNTDVTASGTTDSKASVDDPYLAPFRAGIEAGAPLVMVSSARYPRLDPDHRAMFSTAIITDLLRTRLGFDGVVITDDVGAAKAVASVPVGARATRFIAAGGDVVLTANAAQAPTMLAAIAAQRAKSDAFGAQVDAAAARVLDLKVDLGLVKCG